MSLTATPPQAGNPAKQDSFLRVASKSKVNQRPKSNYRPRPPFYRQKGENVLLFECLRLNCENGNVSVYRTINEVSGHILRNR